ncbi:MAG: hypothetical protein ACYSVY_16480 [Planctomycetota bacterium]
MGDQPSLGPFFAEDGFLRRVDRKRRIADDIVTWEAFKPRESEAHLSFTYEDDSLKTDEGLTAYHRAKALPRGDLPGICKLTFHDLTQALEPPLRPRPERDRSDEEYGHLHCVTDCPSDELHMRKMATLATRNGVLRRFIRHRKA